MAFVNTDRTILTRVPIRDPRSQIDTAKRRRGKINPARMLTPRYFIRINNRFTIVSDTKNSDKFAKNFLSFNVQCDEEAFDKCVITINGLTELNRLRKKGDTFDTPVFAIGNTIEVNLGFANELNKVFSGIVVKVEGQFQKNNKTLKITLFDGLWRLSQNVNVDKRQLDGREIETFTTLTENKTEFIVGALGPEFIKTATKGDVIFTKENANIRIKDILNSIALRNNMSISDRNDDITLQNTNVIQPIGMSDLDFLKGINKTITDKKSKEIGNFRIFTTFEQGKFVLNYRRRKDISTVQSTFTYIWGKDYTDNTNTLLSFNTTLDNINKPAEITFGSVEPKKKKIEEESSVGKTFNSMDDYIRPERERKLQKEKQDDQKEIKQFINFSAFEQNISYIVTTQPLNKDTAKARAQNWLIKHKDDFITATGEIFGNPFLTVGDVINIQGIGKMFGGKYFLTQVTHITNQNIGYVTKFTCKKIIKEQ